MQGWNMDGNMHQKEDPPDTSRRVPPHQRSEKKRAGQSFHFHVEDPCASPPVQSSPKSQPATPRQKPFSNLDHPRSSQSQTFHKLGHELSFFLPPFPQALSLRHTTQRSAVCSPPEASSSHNSAPSSRSHPSQNLGPWPEHGSAPCQRLSPKMRPPRSPRRCSSRSETHGSLPISISSSCSLARRSRWTTISTLRTWRQIV